MCDGVAPELSIESDLAEAKRPVLGELGGDLSYPLPRGRGMRLLHELGPRYGFGFADGTVRLREPLVATSYCVKRLAETVAEPSSPRIIVWVSRRLTDRTGCTIRALPHRRFVYATTTGSSGA